MNTEELRVKFEELFKLPSETEWVEFKTATNAIHFNELGKYFSALSNEANLKSRQWGWLVLGVKESPREIIGTNYRKKRQDLDELLLDKLSDVLTKKQKKTFVTNLLQEMRREDQSIESMGATRSARWILHNLNPKNEF